MVSGDPDQLEQLLINLRAQCRGRSPAKPKAESACTWRKAGPQVEVRVKDEGPGLSNTANVRAVLYDEA